VRQDVAIPVRGPAKAGDHQVLIRLPVSARAARRTGDVGKRCFPSMHLDPPHRAAPHRFSIRCKRIR
jgi:hypothetical protein